MRQRKKESGIVSGINITPFTDVILVLLIIFMVTTPMLIQSEIKVNLPNAHGAKSEMKQKDILIIIDSSGRIFIDNKKVELEELDVAIKSLLGVNKDALVIINGDKRVEYNMVVKVLDIARQAGAQKFSLGIELSK
jgi:biopolymer transport protein TolR